VGHLYGLAEGIGQDRTHGSATFGAPERVRREEMEVEQQGLLEEDRSGLVWQVVQALSFELLAAASFARCEWKFRATCRFPLLPVYTEETMHNAFHCGPVGGSFARALARFASLVGQPRPL